MMKRLEPVEYQDRNLAIIRVIQKTSSGKERLGVRFSNHVTKNLNLKPGERFHPKRIGKSIILTIDGYLVSVGTIYMKKFDKAKFFSDFPVYLSCGASRIDVITDTSEVNKEILIRRWASNFGKFDVKSEENRIIIREDHSGDETEYLSPVKIIDSLMDILQDVLTNFIKILKEDPIKIWDSFVMIEELEDEVDKLYMLGISRISKPLLKLQKVGDFGEISNLKSTCEGLTLLRLNEASELLMDEFNCLADLMKTLYKEHNTSFSSMLSTISKQQVTYGTFTKDFYMYIGKLEELLTSGVELVKKCFNNSHFNEQKLTIQDKEECRKKVRIAKILVNNKEYLENSNNEVTYDNLVEQLTKVENLEPFMYIKTIETLRSVRFLISISGWLHKLLLTYSFGYEVFENTHILKNYKK